MTESSAENGAEEQFYREIWGRSILMTFIATLGFIVALVSSNQPSISLAFAILGGSSVIAWSIIISAMYIKR